MKMSSGVLAIGSGLALGREGPTVQMGGAIADGIARCMKTTPRDRLTLTAAGAGAGLAAAFNAPLSGLVFVLEEVQRDFRPAVFGAAFVAAAAARCGRTLGIRATAGVCRAELPDATAYRAARFCAARVVAGLLGIYFNRSLLLTLSWVGRFTPRCRLVLCAVSDRGDCSGSGARPGNVAARLRNATNYRRSG